MPQTAQQVYYSQALQAANTILNPQFYSPYIAPWTGINALLNVTVAVNIYKLLALTNGKTLSVAMEIDLSWVDPFVPVNWTELVGQPKLYVNTSSVWIMNFYLQNPADSHVYIQPINLVYLSDPENGQSGAVVSEKIIDQFSVVCSTMNLVNFPYDSQTCYLQMNYTDGNYINFLTGNPIQTSETMANDEWQVENVTWGNSSGFVNSHDAQVGFTIVMVFSRNSYYYTVFLIAPTIVLEAIATLTFLLPTDRGEKVVLGATVILGVNVLLTGLNMLIPQMEPDQVPKIATALEIGYIMTGVSLIEGVVIQTLRIMAHDIPDHVALRVDQFLSKATLTCCKSKLHFHADQATNLQPLGSEQSQSKLETELASESYNVSTSGRVMAMKQQNVSRQSFLERTGTSLCSIESVLRQLLEYRIRKHHKRQLVERAWRKVEYVLNFIMLVVYTAVMSYYMGYYIFSDS